MPPREVGGVVLSVGQLFIGLESLMGHSWSIHTGNNLPGGDQKLIIFLTGIKDCLHVFLSFFLDTEGIRLPKTKKSQ